MKKTFSLLVSALLAGSLYAQKASYSQTVLRLPVSSHIAALGGENVSVMEDTPWAGRTNPALYSSVSDKSLGLNFMTYANGSFWAGAQFTKAFGERHTGAIAAQMMNYGSMDETDAMGNVLGEFSPKDIIVGAGYSYLLSDHWAGGANLNTIYSKYADFSAFALSVDLGINYFDEEQDFSVSAVLRNIGAPIKSFDDRTERLPFNLQVGFTKGMSHAPVRISVTMTDLTRWKSSDYFVAEEEQLNFGKKLLHHFVVGVDILPTDYLYLSAGYNFRRAYELKAAGSAHGAGLTFGGGLLLSKFKIGASYAKYHVSTSSLMFNLGYTL
ncbi:hypothetical protein, secreted [gut metagenome]|uniref:Uncharacterized protein n=1 Tax=gut metagenome TaxID=749906 RepID=J9G941_9ZZZZ